MDFRGYSRRRIAGFAPALIGGMDSLRGVVLGADTRATEGAIVADKNCDKIHYLAPNMYCCGAGTAADTEAVTAMTSARLALHRLNSRRESRVVTALTFLKQHLFRYQGHVGAALVLGGVDCTGPQLYTVYPHGSTDALPYVTMGSGSLAAMAVFEAGWRRDMARDEAIALVTAAVRAGILNDLGSGSNVDVVVIDAETHAAEKMRSHERPTVRSPREVAHVFPPGTTPVLRTERRAVSPPVVVEPADAQPLHAPMVGIEDLELEPARRGDPLAGGRDAAEQREDEAADGIDVVVLGADVEPEEIVMHLPLLCEEKKIPFIFINKQNDIGTASGLDVGSAAAAIVKPGKAKELVDEIVKQVSELRA